MTALRRLIAKALKVGTPTIEGYARDLGLSTSALRRYRLGNRTPPAALASRLARLLRQRAAVMVRHAAELDAILEEEGPDDSKRFSLPGKPGVGPGTPSR
jgi:hypothetical protein